MSKTILITGSSSGIGKASVTFFADKGWNVIATMRNTADGVLWEGKTNVLVAKLDVLDLASIDKAIADGISKFGKIDVVMNNAGYGVVGVFEATSRESMQRQFAVNVQGLFDVTQKVLPHFRANKSGMFINISSVGGKFTFPLISMYHSSKFAVEGFSESLHYELAELGIKVKIVEPGGVTTDFGSRSMDFQQNPELTDYNEYTGKVMAGMTKRMSQNEDISSPEYIAGILFDVANDESDTLRYAAGKDAEKYLAARKSMSDQEFFAFMRNALEV